MKKKLYILLLIIFLSITNTSKTSKNLRNLANSLTFKSAEKLVYGDMKLTFEITIEETTVLSTETQYKLTILIKNEKKTASCKYNNADETHKLICEYQPTNPYYGLIQLPKSEDALASDEISLGLGTPFTLQQEVELQYKEANIEFISNANPTYYKLKITLEQALIDNSFYQVDIKKDDSEEIVDCQSTSDYLICDNIKGGKSNLIKLVKIRNNGSVKWIYEGSDEEFEKSLLLKFEITYIFGYDLNFETDKWTFKLRESSANIHKSGYYFTINTILKKLDNTDLKAQALCSTTENVYLQNCIVDKMISPLNGIQEEKDLVYLSSENKDEASIFVKDTSLNSNKIISRIMTLTFEKAYELKFINSIYNFKIKISETGLREGLNVTVDLFRESTEYHTGSCTYSEQILSCVRDKKSGQQDEELFYLSFEKKYGSVTWNGKSSGKIRIPFEIELTHSESYYLIKQETNWTFNLKATVPINQSLPKNSLFIVDISYGSDGKTTAKCEGDKLVSKGMPGTFACEIEYTEDDNPEFKLINKESGSVTWKNYGEPIPIYEKILLTFGKAYNMKWENSNKKWVFNIDFTNNKNIRLKITDIYKVDISYLSGTSYNKIQASCRLAEENGNTFNCEYGQIKIIYYLLIKKLKQLIIQRLLIG